MTLYSRCLTNVLVSCSPKVSVYNLKRGVVGEGRFASGRIQCRSVFRQMVGFLEPIKEARPEELQRLLRLQVRHVKWMPNGEHVVEYYRFAPAAESEIKTVAKTKNQSPNHEITNQDWLYIDVRLGCPGRRSLEPVQCHGCWVGRLVGISLVSWLAVS